MWLDLKNKMKGRQLKREKCGREEIEVENILKRSKNFAFQEGKGKETGRRYHEKLTLKQL